MGLEGRETAGQPQVTLLPTPNVSGLSQEFESHWPEIADRSPCLAGIIPSVLLGLGLPVSLLTAVALAHLATRTRKPSYYYLLALTASDIIIQVGAVLARQVPQAVVRMANILEFAANHASVWIAILLTVDHYTALCHPLHHRATSSPGRTRRAIAAVLSAALLTGIPFYWWLGVWRDTDSPSTLDESGLQPRVGKSTAILLGITTLFTLLWAPRVFVMLYHMYLAPVHRDWRVHLALDVANMVAMLHTAANFSLYCLVSKTFRAVIHDAYLPCTLASQPEGMAAKPVMETPGLPEGAEG
uniref:G-protein coupled receptors family 1 profile domain-containing protein n=1 Tax=Nomascus leucogenys TaxID=61853 RepID=A0A2I3G148_NOMLE